MRSRRRSSAITGASEGARSSHAPTRAPLRSRDARDVLLDTGPLVAVLDARDQWHERCAQAFPDLVHRCVTTEAVVTEACHLALRGGRTWAPLEFLLAARIPILGVETGGQRRARVLMERYGALPMDYADATLCAVAEALRISTVFTLDRRGFSTYQPAGVARFTLLP
jgi:predicted nucleic acid-binding protein